MLVLATMGLSCCAVSQAADQPENTPVAAHKPTGGSLQHPPKEKAVSARDILKSIKGDDPRESDLPLIIKIEVLPVPEEIKGPFPADAPWRKKK
jgi:hypothetical protein